MSNKIYPGDVFKDVVNGNMTEDEFVAWYSSEMAKAHSLGYSQGSDYAYRREEGLY